MSAAFLPFAPDATLRIGVAGSRPGRMSSIEQEWAKACDANPRLFDGEILAVSAIDPGSGTIRAIRERFAHVVCQPSNRAVPVTILSVTGVIEAVFEGEDAVLFARRGQATRSYPGMWELAPAGGLHPVPSSCEVGLDHVLQTLRTELAEEVGITRELTRPRVVGVVIDPRARSADIVVRARLVGEVSRPVIPSTSAWECADARWIATGDIHRFTHAAAGGVIEPTIAIVRHLGWPG